MDSPLRDMKKKKRIESLIEIRDFFQETIERQKLNILHSQEELYHSEQMLKLIKKQLKALNK